jgi:hypothetical protein
MVDLEGGRFLMSEVPLYREKERAFAYTAVMTVLK